MRNVEISGSHERMDNRNFLFEPVNPLPAHCPTCGFPDLDFVPQPYYLIKSRSMTPNEVAEAEVGNFLVRNRVRRVLDLVAPGQCTFYPTCYQRTTEPTPWLLAVPSHQIVTANVDPSIPRCEDCGQPRSAHPGTQWNEVFFGTPIGEQVRGEGWTTESKFDILKSSNWGSLEHGWDREFSWISRDLFFSLRLLHLLKQIKVRGVEETTCEGEPLKPNKVESSWIEGKLRECEGNGISLHATGTLSTDDAAWFRRFIKAHALKDRLEWNIKEIQKQVNAMLPKSYVEFVRKVGPMSFENVDEQGIAVSIVPPTEIQNIGFDVQFEDEESKAVNALPFATTDHGDCFCFDVQQERKEFTVHKLNHEFPMLEPYAENFVGCIKRFAGGGE